MRTLLLLITCCLAGLIFPLSAFSGEDEELQLMPQINQAQNSVQGPGAAQNPNIIPQTAGAVPPQPALFDIYGPVRTSEPIPYLYIGLALAALLAIALLLYYLRKKRKEKLPPPIPPWDIALSELAEAKSIRTPEHGLSYMDRAGQILRRYIESRFSVQTTRQTTLEFLHSKSLQKNRDLEQFRGELQECLEQADMAKFAHRIPDTTHLMQMEDSVTTFVVKTKPLTTNSFQTESEGTFTPTKEHGGTR